MLFLSPLWGRKQIPNDWHKVGDKWQRSHKIKHLFPYLPSNLFLGVSNLKYMQSQFWKSWQLSTFSLYNSSNVFEVEHSWELWTLLTSPLLGLLSSMEIKTGAWNRLCITVLLHVGNCFVVLFVFCFGFFFSTAKLLQDISLNHKEMHRGNT